MYIKNDFARLILKYSVAFMAYMLSMYVIMMFCICVVAYFMPSILEDVMLQLVVLAFVAFFAIIDMARMTFNKLSVGYIIFNKVFGVDFKFDHLFKELDTMVRAYDVGK